MLLLPAAVVCITTIQKEEVLWIAVSDSQGRSDGGYIGIYTHPKSVHLKFLWGIFSSSCEAETS